LKLKKESVPAGILKDVPHDGVRRAAVVVSHADVSAPDFVFLRDVFDAHHQVVFSCN
jgi:hypothetical protein